MFVTMGLSTSRLKSAISLACILICFSLCQSLPSNENRQLCAVDPATGEQECKTSYENQANEEVGTKDIPDYPVPTIDDIYHDEGVYVDPYAVWDEDEERDVADWSTCYDRHEDCSSLAEENACDSNPGFMHFQCPESCNTCDDFYAAEGEICTDNDVECKSWAASGECGFNPGYMHHECMRSCLKCYVDTNQFGITQYLPAEDDELYEKTKRILDESIKYVRSIWDSSNPDHDRINYKCRNMDKQCSYFAAQGECKNNEDWMKINCAPACQTCELLDIRLRCPFEDDNEMVFQPGDLNKLMERIVDNSDGKGKYLKYNPKALSRPMLKADGTPSGAEVDGPWIVQFENFVSRLEALALISAGSTKGYERSEDVGEENPDGTHEGAVSEDRTSHNAWCDYRLCNEDPIIRPVIERISSVTDTPISHSEHIQLLQYSPGQFYRQHHDYIEYQQELPCGPRALTMFLYLNDVEEGGGTHFPLLDITVEPKMGNAILWPSVLDGEPEKKDPRTDHEALEVTKGVKYGANAWIHTRDYWKAEENDCT